MATHTDTVEYQQSKPYCGYVGITSTAADWTFLRGATSNWDNYDNVVIYFSVGNVFFEEYSNMFRGSFGFDISPDVFPNGMTASAGGLNLKHVLSDDNMITTTNWDDDDKGLVLVVMDETTKVTEQLDNEDYESMTSSMTEVSNVIPYSSFVPDDWFEFQLNAAGLAYVNQINAKPDYPGTALFGLAIVGDARNEAPSPFPGLTGVQIKHQFYSADGGSSVAPYLELTYTSNAQVNIGDAWKEVETIQVNVGDVWKDVDSIQPNIGDDWKDIV